MANRVFEIHNFLLDFAALGSRGADLHGAVAKRGELKEMISAAADFCGC
jgi:hypothetical protein